MTDPSSRRNFLRGRFSSPKAALRPPWALAEPAFLHACTRCGDCERACPTRVIHGREAGYPIVDFSSAECTFCGECAASCKTGALKRTEESRPWTARAVVARHCLALRHVECRVCSDQCEAQAIRFMQRAGGIATPSIDAESCNGCGACVAPCPSGAISVA